MQRRANFGIDTRTIIRMKCFVACATVARRDKTHRKKIYSQLNFWAAAALFFAASKSNALTGQSLIVSHGWFME
jgi:hypothetical protein